jgi:hypothetical protein
MGVFDMVIYYVTLLVMYGNSVMTMAFRVRPVFDPRVELKLITSLWHFALTCVHGESDDILHYSRLHSAIVGLECIVMEICMYIGDTNTNNQI